MMKIKLFDYQEDMLLRIAEAFKSHQSVMAQMPTGTGKTYLLAAIIGAFLGKADKHPIWVVAHRRELIEQIKETLDTFFSPRPEKAILVTSIQWLSRHYHELREKPGLIVIDEAHHALAETYAEVMNAYPKAKKLGLTATPYRMNGKGFTDLFDILLCSWNMERFIAEGRLSLYDYYSIKPDSADQILIDSLKKRGADGDYQQKELNEVMDVKPSLERLCLTIKEYVPGKKGIVYAISIQHAEHIAEFYRENGIMAMAISSKTPLAERKMLIEKFKESHTDFTESTDEIQVLVSVDLFSEGFDCPDVEFIQLARPTLSLAKYMQMVGRGLRVAEGKDCCVILDNVGLYKRFGLPSVDRDWGSMFEGKSSLEDILQEACLHLNSHNCMMDKIMAGDDEMMEIISHERQQQIVKESYGYQLVSGDNGRFGIQDMEGKMVVDCLYQRIEMTNDGFAYCYARGKLGKTPWVDLRNGLWFAKKPQTVKLMGIDFCTLDGKRLYPRIRSKFINENAYLTLKTLELQVGTGVNWKRRFIAWNNPHKVYRYQERINRVRVFQDDEGNCVAQENVGSDLIPVSSPEMLRDFCGECEERHKQDAAIREKMEKNANHYDSFRSATDLLKEGRMEKDGIVYVKNYRDGQEAWIDIATRRIYESKPTTFKRGFVSLLKDGDWCYIRNIPALEDKPFRPWEIVADDNICVVNHEFLFIKNELLQWFKICKRSDDFSFFVVKEYSKYSDMAEKGEIQITQFDGEGLRMTKNGYPYTPFVSRVSIEDRRRWKI